MKLTVIIPTYNPNLNWLGQTILGLRAQTLALDQWELIIVNNNSQTDFENQLDLNWHPAARVIKERQQGLTFARLKGFAAASGELIVMVDDDNILDPNYLKEALEFMEQHQQVGTVGGKSIAKFDFVPEPWTLDFLSAVAVRDLGDESLISSTHLYDYPSFSPIGAGMVVRKKLLHSYIENILSGSDQITDRIGGSLSSGGDNEINIFVLKQGFAVAYFPKLSLQHIIPQNRLTKDYLARLSFESTTSWVKLLHKHQICPWPPIPAYTLKLRYLKAYFSFKAWFSNQNYVKWKAACGLLKGQSQISYQENA